MKYLFHSNDFLKDFFQVNNLNQEDLIGSSFSNEFELEPVLAFKEKMKILNNKKVLIVGDYDCDGICSTVIIKKLLDHLNIKNNFYIPSRSKDGYGLNERIVKMAKENAFEVILTVDNGVSSFEAIELCKKEDILLFIIDHHNYKDVPDCEAFLHPELLTEEYNNLSCGGLCTLLSTYFYDDSLSKVLGGLSTLSDMVGVLKYNRYLLKRMLEILKSEDIYQILLLNEDEISYDSLSFNVIPKINSISRMDNNPNILVKYFLSDKKTCLNTIKAINDVNNERKKLSEDISSRICENVLFDKNIYIVYMDDIKEGLCGLIANKLLMSHLKPVIVFTKSEGIYKGSARSGEDFSIYDYLFNTKEIFETFGGHGQACGLSIKEDNLPKLIEYLDENEILKNEVIKNIYELNKESDSSFLEVVESLKPFGVDLKEPLFRISDVSDSKCFMVSGKYPRYQVSSSISAIDFKSRNRNDYKDFIGTIRKDKYHKNSISFIIEDLI